MDDDAVQCLRCHNTLTLESEPFRNGEPTIDGDFLCGDCLSPEQRHALEQQTRAFADALLAPREPRGRRESDADEEG